MRGSGLLPGYQAQRIWNVSAEAADRAGINTSATKRRRMNPARELPRLSSCRVAVCLQGLEGLASQ